MSDVGWTGRERTRVTPWRTRASETVMRGVISAGGFGTIAAVLLIFVFLLFVVIPLFLPGTLGNASTPTALHQRSPGNERPLYFASDELKTLRLTLWKDGSADVHRADGSLVSSAPLFGGIAPTCMAKDPGTAIFAFGFEDGTVRQGTIRFATRFLSRDERRHFATQEGTPSELGALLPHDEGALIVTHRGDMRLQYVEIDIGEPIEISSSPIAHADISLTTRGPVFAALSEDSVLALYETNEEMDMMTGETVTSVDRFELPFAATSGSRFDDMVGVFLDGASTTLSVLWRDGRLLRFDARREHLALAEQRDVLVDGSVTTATWLIGKSTLLVGDSSGGVGTWFLTRDDPDVSDLPPMGSDAQALVSSRAIEDHNVSSPVTQLSPSARTRLVVASHKDGTLRVVHTTTGNEIVRTKLEDGVAVLAARTAPKDDAVIALSDRGSMTWPFDARHPEVTFASLFAPVWYEGYAEPTNVWQSSGGDGFEPKLGLWPLIFGTLKATLYAMLFAAPLAILAAIYTTQFLSLGARAPVKTCVELMAGLPSVVLGFIAGLAIAPYIQTVLPATMLSFVLVPFALLLGARLWQFLPDRIAREREGGSRFALMGVALVMGVLLAALLGPWLSRVCFDGDLVEWLGRSDRGGGILTWAFFLLPVAALLAVYVMSSVVGPRFRALTHGYTRAESANADLLKFLAGAVLAIVCAGVLGTLAYLVLGDPRSTLFGGYTQKNALIVGFVMGFAVIPIIFTIADDALSSVPRQLKEGSLGAGATRWQTTWRVMLPAAMSGIFSALMVGLGRAVGETMIVLMAVGNSPIMDVNPFNGFRTLAANIAVELPEAVKDSSHYRTLFLAALVLFAMTFVINTIAEVVRRRFRKRFAQL